MIAFSSHLPYPSTRQPVYGDEVVATSQPLAVSAAMAQLAQGGNAIDAALAAEVRLYEELFTTEQPDNLKDGDYRDFLNPHSLTVLPEARLERSLSQSRVGERFQFERQGFFIKDLDSTAEKPVFNRIVPLKDGWAKVLEKS